MCGIPGISVVDLFGEETGKARGKEKAEKAAERDGSSPAARAKEKDETPTR